jgi:hypothetical protein
MIAQAMLVSAWTALDARATTPFFRACFSNKVCENNAEIDYGPPKKWCMFPNKAYIMSAIWTIRDCVTVVVAAWAYMRVAAQKDGRQA